MSRARSGPWRGAATLAAFVALLPAAGCRLVDDPPADAAYACRADDEAPPCPDGQACVVAVADEPGFCGAPGPCFTAADDRGVSVPADDCTPCDIANGAPGAPGACVAGACAPVDCDSACHVADCGDACLDDDEGCDDGNDLAGDGCRGCVEEEGWLCAGAPSTCTVTCGDQRVAAPRETCDDGNANPADACDACAAVVWRRDDGTAALPALPPGATLTVRSSDHCVEACVDGACRTLGVCGVPGALGAHLSRPRAAAFGPDRAVVYVADTGNQRVLRFDATTRAVVVGTGEASSTGAGAPARALPVQEPDGLAVDAFGNLFVTTAGRLRAVANVDGDADADGDDALIDPGAHDTATPCVAAGERATAVAVDGDALVVTVDGAPRRCTRGAP